MVSEKKTKNLFTASVLKEQKNKPSMKNRFALIPHMSGHDDLVTCKFLQLQLM